jgi:hypothetical protein
MERRLVVVERDLRLNLVPCVVTKHCKVRLANIRSQYSKMSLLAALH